MFRPVAVAVAFGPDGCLYIADWYNRIISHNVVKYDHPARDKSRGRIWRIRHTDQTRIPEVPDFTTMPTEDLVAALDSDSTWAMRAARNQIADRDAQELIPQLTANLRSLETPIVTKIVTLWALEELGHFDPDLWATLLADNDPHLRREAVRALTTLNVAQDEAAPLLQKSLAVETSWTVRYAVLRYFRQADGALAPSDHTWLKAWAVGAPTQAKAKGKLTLDGSYQHAFQDFLLRMAVNKTQLPVFIESKWDGVLATHESGVDEKALAERITAIREHLADADLDAGKQIVESVCLTCHSLGDKGIGFAPPLDGSEARDLEGLITAIIHPDAAVEEVFRAYQVQTKDGRTLEGFKSEENQKEIILKLMGGAEIPIPLADIKQAGYFDGRSMMPNLTAGMDAAQVAAIIAYLRSAKPEDPDSGE